MKLWRTIQHFLEKSEQSETAILVLALLLALVQLTKSQPGPAPILTATPVPISTVAPSTTTTITPRLSNTAYFFTVTASATAAMTVDLYFNALPYPLARDPQDWTVSDDGVRFAAFYEGFVERPYDDGGQPGVGNCTIGYGHLLHLGPCNGSEGIGSISQATAYEWLRQELNHCGEYVAKYTTVRLTQTQYNILAGAVCGYGYDRYRTSEMLKLLNEGKYYEAAERMRTTGVYGIGIGLCPGLVRRRLNESILFLKPLPFSMWPFIEVKP